MSLFLSNLSNALKHNNESEITELLQSKQNCITLENNCCVKSLLSQQNEEILYLGLELVAEWVKLEHNRIVLTEEHVINMLLLLLPTPKLTVNAVRVLGNICYENEQASKLIDEKGVETILQILSVQSERDLNIELLTKTSGLLVNILITNEDVRKDAIQKKTLQIINNLLNRLDLEKTENEDLFCYLMTIINLLNEYDTEQNIFTEDFCFKVLRIFNSYLSNPEITVTCLEIFFTSSERDDIKILLAKNNTCETVFNLIEKYKNLVNDEESRHILKMACDLIIIVLTQDECMNILYDNGNGMLYKNFVNWLDSNDPDLLSTASLAIGNFARNDNHCIDMVKSGISTKLIDLLKCHNSPDDNVKLQHALLSTFKNLVIPVPNKIELLKQGLIEVTLPLVQTKHEVVMFKLLGTIRMVMIGQEKAACDMISRKDVITTFVYWCYNSDHLGVRGEVPRLLAWLVLNCNSSTQFNDFIQIDDSVKCIVEMLSSNHTLMQNEAAEALYLLHTSCWLSQKQTDNKLSNACILDEQLLKADIGKHINYVLNKCSEKCDQKSLENFIKLMEQFVKSKSITECFRLNNISQILQKLTFSLESNASTEKLSKLAEELK